MTKFNNFGSNQQSISPPAASRQEQNSSTDACLEILVDAAALREKKNDQPLQLD